MSCEELGAIFEAKKIKVEECEETKYNTESSKQARNYGVTGGVFDAVKKKLPNEAIAKPCVIDGLNKESIKQLRKYALNGQCDDDCNMLEVMFCEGGCIGGNSTISLQKTAKERINNLLSTSNDEEKLQ